MQYRRMGIEMYNAGSLLYLVVLSVVIELTERLTLVYLVWYEYHQFAELHQGLVQTALIKLDKTDR